MFLIGAENEITQYYTTKHIKTANTISPEYIFRRDSGDFNGRSRGRKRFLRLSSSWCKLIQAKICSETVLNRKIKYHRCNFMEEYDRRECWIWFAVCTGRETCKLCGNEMRKKRSTSWRLEEVEWGWSGATPTRHSNFPASFEAWSLLFFHY